MSRATFTFGRFNVPTEEGHGKLVKAVQAHAEKTGGSHYIFPSHSQDAKKNPLEHGQKTGFMRRLFPNANIVSQGKVRTAIDAMKHLEKKGHTHVTMVVGSDRVEQFNSLLNKYRKKEYPGIKSVKVVSGGNRDPDAEGAEGMSASKLRDLVRKGKRSEFISHYSDKKLGAELHDVTKKGMQMESKTPIGIFLLGGPGSGKDYVLSNIFSRFDLIEVQIDQLLNGSASELVEKNQNIVINGSIDQEKIEVVKSLLEGYEFDYVFVSVSNKVSRERNALRDQPLSENKRIEKFLKAEKLAESIQAFNFNNSINLNESKEMERIFFGSQIEKLLERLVNIGLVIQETSEPRSFMLLREKKFAPVAKDKESGLPKKYVAGLSTSTAKARKAHWKKMSKYSDKDPRAYEPAPGDATAKTKPSKHTLAVRKMMDEASSPAQQAAIAINMKKRGVKPKNEEVVDEGTDSSLAAKAEKSGISVSTLRKVYKRGVAAWNSGHRPGTTPQQWGHARVNSYINKGKTYHTADKDLREEADIDELFEMQLVGTDEYRRHAISMTPGQSQEIEDVTKGFNPIQKKKDCGCGGNCKCNSGSVGEGSSRSTRTFTEFTTEAKEDTQTVDITPTLKTRKAKNDVKRASEYRSDLQGTPVSARFNALEAKEPKGFMPTPRQVPAYVPAGTKMIDGIPQHNVPKGFKRVRDNIAGFKLVKEELTLKEAVEYHLNNKISFTENTFRPGSEMFFEMISEAKRLYAEGKYTPADEWEKDMLESNIGEIAQFEGQTVVLDFPIEEGLEECWTGYVQRGMKKKGDKMVPNCVPVNEEDKTDGKGIGKPFRQGSGGAVYVRTEDGGVKKVRFSQSGMKKRYNEPARVRSFVARHRCLTNKDKTSASYWACRWPRYFSNTGQLWW